QQALQVGPDVCRWRSEELGIYVAAAGAQLAPAEAAQNAVRRGVGRGGAPQVPRSACDAARGVVDACRLGGERPRPGAAARRESLVADGVRLRRVRIGFQLLGEEVARDFADIVQTLLQLAIGWGGVAKLFLAGGIKRLNGLRASVHLCD